MKRIYLAARYFRREELCRYRKVLERYGYVVTSRWLNGNMFVDDDFVASTGSDAERVRYATEDWEDLASADILLFFTDTPGANSRGGRHIEFGHALATEKRVMVVGVRENVFHWLPEVEVFPEWGDAWRVLTMRKLTSSLNLNEPAPAGSGVRS